MFDAVKVKNDCVQWIRNWFEMNGKDCNAVMGISGGADSTVVATLCVEALGKDRVKGILMPQWEQDDIIDSYKLCNHLGIEYIVCNIGNPVEAVLHSIRMSDKTVQPFTFSKQTTTNLPARIRMATLYAISQSINGRVANTCNLSEDWVGYSTRWGDSVCDFSPLSNITKTEVKEIGKALGLPNELVYKTPSDGLCGKTDEDNLGFTYEVLDRYIRTGEIEDMDVKAKINSMHEKNLFKLQPIPSFPYSLNEK